MASRKLPDSPTRMTEFAPLSSDVKPSGGFFSRIFKRKGNSNADGDDDKSTSSNGSQASSRETSQSREATPTRSASGAVEEDWEAGGGVVVDVDDIPSDSDSTTSSSGGQPRTLSSVLRRLSNILDRRSQTPQAYKDSDFKQYWMPDSDCRECYECSDKFNTFRRRHHCRICGQIFCSRCCNQEVPGKIMGYTGFLRVCTYCCKVVLSYAQHQEASDDLRTLSEDLKHLSAVEDSGTYAEVTGWTPTAKRKSSKSSRVSSLFNEDKQRSSHSPELHSPTLGLNPFDVTPLSEYSRVDNFQYERRILTQDSVQLRELWILMQHPVDGIEMQSHRHRLRTHPNCIVGGELVDWLIARDKAADRVQALAIGQALVDAKWLECVTSGEPVFRDEYSLYRPGEASTREDTTETPVSTDKSMSDDEDNAPSWFREIRRTDEDGDSLREFNKIPSTVSGNDLSSDGNARSVFYVGGTQLPEKPKRVRQSLSSVSSDKGSSSTTIAVTLSDLVKDCSLWEEENELEREVSLDTADGVQLLHQDSVTGAITDELFKGAFAVSGDKMAGDEVGWQNPEQMKEDNGEHLAYEVLSKAYREHLQALTNQLLMREGLSLKWSETVLSVICKVAQVVRPDVKHEEDDMDIRQYIQIKKIPGGNRTQTSIICGVVCTKNVTHKKMRSHIVNPKVLLLRAPIEYQRVENKFSSLEPQILQEDKFLKNCVGRIAGLEPDILLVEKSASRVAQEFLLHAGITLVINVKPSVMERVARFTQADIVSSVDGLVSKTALGFCHTFRLKNYTLPNGTSKTLMYFDGCASHLGCTVTLRGGSLPELTRVKKIMQFMTYSAYHGKLETAFIMDEFAMPPIGPTVGEFPIASLVPSPTALVQPQPPSEGGSRHSSVEMAEEAVPGTVTTKNVSELFSLSAHSDDQAFEAIKTENMKKTETKAEIQVKKLEVELTKTENAKVSEGENSSGNDNNPVSDPSSNEKPKMKAEGTTDCSETTSKTTKRLSREISTISEIVQDFSDPLQNYQKSKDESIFESTTEALKEEVRSTQHRFRQALDDVILTVSPYLKYDIPYLKTDPGEGCVLRQYFPKDIYWSRTLESEHGEKLRPKFHAEPEEEKPLRDHLTDTTLEPPHPFVTAKLTAPLGDPNTQAMLVDFRARGGRITYPPPPQTCEWNKQSRNGVEEKGLPLTSSFERRIDCLDPYQHQRIAVLFSSFSYVSNNTPNPCVNPWIVSMDFYGRNDITLGGFLERYCFRETYTCPSESCDTPMVDHIRRFVHDHGCIQIVLKKLEAPIHGYQNSILTWAWCRRCKRITPVAPLSLESWSMSFAKYLELRFHGNMYTRRTDKDICPHSIHHDHYQYFGSGQIVASFKYVSVQMKEIVLPPILIALRDSGVPLSQLVEDAKALSFKGTAVYSTILEHLHRLKRDSQTDAQATLLSEYIAQLQDTKEVFRQCVDEIQTKLSSAVPLRDGQLDNVKSIGDVIVLAPVAHDITDSVVEVKRQIAEAVNNWNNRIQDFEQQQRKLEKARGTSSIGSKGSRDALNTPDTVWETQVTTSSRWQHGKQQDETADMENEPTFFIAHQARSDPDGADQPDASVSSSVGSHHHDPSPGTSVTSQDVTDMSSSATSGRAVTSQGTSGDLNVPANPSLSGLSDLSGSEGSLSALEKSGEKTIDEVDTGGTKEVKGHYRSKSLGDSRRMSKQLSMPHDTSANELDRLERSSKAVKQLFTSLLSSSDSSAVTMPFSADEHHLLPPGDSVPIVVYDQEPSSIIAYTLCSAEYERQLRDLKSDMIREQQNPSPNVRRNKRDSIATGTGSDAEPSKRGGSGVLAFFRGAARERSPNRLAATTDAATIDTVRYTPRLDKDSFDDADDFSVIGQGVDGDKIKSKTATPESHIELQFADSTAKFYCRVYYADQFRQLRKSIFPAGEQRYIRSLSRCFTWLARGGKSGSTFCKTQDDRFILKQMSRLEVQSFVDFAPHYFNYIQKCLSEEKPTVLAKILGVYRIGYRNNQTNTALKQDLLVMENLFYDRQITQIFDLKGSMRNRLVNTSGKRVEDLVLLDENLLKFCVDSPLYIRSHSKTVLTMAITNDTQFLSSHLVMDYSLLVGIDDTKKELVVGIIDYIRTFTWDKKLEMVVKSTYSQLGGQGKMPTVVSPELYRSRFLEAMDRYFLLVPDQWSGLGRNIDC